ncbi:hypothetical protein SteCoe_24592 [Stentor coeruleus]|uniref:MARVEL domain-containing protein n=1 Tax=Stentor coeruleus TaxID=5963 RepID=A0A1R2BHA7_9CILI|nr:hypothetical protein SteCoe_24592 [Stentor coeruleus]
MQYPVYNQSQSENALIRANKENVRRGAVVLFTLGLALIVLTHKVFEETDFFYFIITLPIIYILTSIIGFYSVSYDSAIGTLIYSVLLIALIVVNILLSVLSLIFFIYLASTPLDCDPTKTDTCGLGGAVVMIILALSLVSFIASGALAFLLFVFFRNVRKLRTGLQEFQMAEL